MGLTLRPLLFAFIALFTTVAQAQTAGFLGGNRFEFTSATGDVFVSCLYSGGPAPIPGPTTANYRCHGYAFAPGEYAHFAGPRVDADQVELVAYRQDGTNFTKKSAYDPSVGRSTDSFNL